jgi:predicted nucleic acid-binding protein
MGELILPEEGLTYVDANSVIDRVERTELYWSATSALWEALDDGRCAVATSEVTLLEVLVKPIQVGNAELAGLFRDVLPASNLERIPISLSILESAASLRAAHRLKAPDAIHAATAIESGAILFLTNDTDFRKVVGLNVVILDDVIAP